MKTCSNEIIVGLQQTPRSERIALTTCPQSSSRDGVTERVDMAVIGLPKGSGTVCEKSDETADRPGNCSAAFAYEQQRIQELGDSACKFRDTGPQSEVDPRDPRIDIVLNRNREMIEDENNEVENWSIMVRIISIVTIGLSALLILFAIIFLLIVILSVHAKIVMTLIPLALCVLASLWMIYFSIVSSAMSALTQGDSAVFTKFFRLAALSVCGFLIMVTVMSFARPIPELFQRFDDITAPADTSGDKRATAYFSLSYFVTWCSCIINVSLTGLVTVFGLLLRRHLRLKVVYELKHNTLPIGYQVFTQFKNRPSPHL